MVCHPFVENISIRKEGNFFLKSKIDFLAYPETGKIRKSDMNQHETGKVLIYKWYMGQELYNNTDNIDYKFCDKT